MDRDDVKYSFAKFRAKESSDAKELLALATQDHAEYRPGWPNGRRRVPLQRAGADGPGA